MDLKKNKMCKVRLRRLRPELIDKLKSKRRAGRSDVQYITSSSESEDDEPFMIEKISVQLKSSRDLSGNKDLDPFFLLTETQQTLSFCAAKEDVAPIVDSRISNDNAQIVKTVSNTINSAPSERYIKTSKRSKLRSYYYSPTALELNLQRDAHLSTTESGKTYYHSDVEGVCSYNCNQIGVGSAKALSSSPTRRSSTGSSSSCDSVRFSKLFDTNCISVMDDENPPTALSKILSIKEFDPLAPQQLVALIIKSIVSLSDLSQREDNIINVDIDKRRLIEISNMTQEDKRTCRLDPFMDVSDIVVTHPDNEFFTFCLCKTCEEYRELVIHIMVEQFKAAHMVVMLLDVLIKAYGPMLKNITAYNKFEKLLDSKKEIYWITCGVIYHKKGEHLDFIYDEYLSDNMIFVLFSSILMLNNPLLLLQILSFHVECIVKAYAEGFLEIVEPDQNKIPAEEMINYILNGYDDLIRISEQVASYLFAFENDFLRKFSLTWKLLCQRLYQQHIHLHLADTMLACIITLKEEELTSHHTDLIKRYIQFDDIMNNVEKRWAEVWIELNKFNLSEVERKRRKSLLDVYRIFDTVVQDAIAFSLQDSVDDNDFYDFRSLKNRRLAWKNIMSYTKMKWPDGFYQPPNILVVDKKCKTCNVSLDYHAEYCKCITCSIANGPMPPKRNADGKCSKCLAHEIVEKDANFYDSKIVNVCANDDFHNLIKNNSVAKRKSTALQEVGQELYSTLASVEEMLNDNVVGMCKHQLSICPGASGYHISWAVFNHLNNRKRFTFTNIEEQYFCGSCKLPSCQLARKILNNEISPSLSQDLIHFFQPMTMSREELRSILPNIMLYNRKLVASNKGLDFIDVHDLVVKIYWIFVISVYAIYFIDLDDDPDGKHGTWINMDALELSNNDISVNVERIVGNKDDTKFLEFLDKIKSLSPYHNDVDANIDTVINIDNAEIQKKLNDILKISDCQDLSSSCETMPPLIHIDAKNQPPDSDLIPSTTVDSQPKKTCKDKTKKCCFDHSDLGDHCKENHSSKKRLKKDCYHARMNETRDRLRKKLSQIVNARKNSKGSQVPTAGITHVPEPENQMDNVLKAHELKLFQQFQQQLPHSASIIAATFEQMQETKRTEKLHDLCECLQHLQTNQKHSDTLMVTNKKSQHKSTPQKPQEDTSLEPPNKKSNISNNSTRDASTSSNSAKSRDRNNGSTTGAVGEAPQLLQAINDTVITTPAKTVTKTSNSLEFVSEICEIIDNYSKEQAKRKWIKETLNFIEGPDTITGKKKTQPKTSNPKKAAKKAKQKQRKEEEKRIAELQDLRGQFRNIYFKEFTDKHQLKAFKANKKRDKKKISELENNIKNLQRAKAKVETAILELIATVKQTNADFKFSYLPTKEQQLEKVKELEGQSSDTKEDNSIQLTQVYNANQTPFTIRQTNNLIMVPEAYSMPYAHANHFPYNLGFPPQNAQTPFGTMRATPMCYAPPPSATTTSNFQQQNLGPDFVSTMTSDSPASSSIDPSKRIVTIRRVNLPNVPEPQVTVTAKGSSPDKDKLLYTFINGQLIQTGTGPSIGVQQMPGAKATDHVAKMPVDLLTIPPPPPKLTKTQMKKERRRLAKLQEEADAAEEAKKIVQEEEHQKRWVLEEQKLLELQQLQQHTKQQKKKKKTSQAVQIPSCSTNKDIKPKQKNKLTTSNSTTSVSTNEANESHAQLPQMVIIHKAAKSQKRSASTTTSCSAATSFSSNNSTSSQVNTRDNSVSSLKPSNSKATASKKHTKEQKPLCATNILKIKQSCVKSEISLKKSTPPNSSSESSTEEVETEEKLYQSAKQQQKNTKSNPSKQVMAKQKAAKGNMQRLANPKAMPNSDSEDELPAKQQQSLVKTKLKRKRKLVDNGQFDNNPFKSLHQDSDSDWSSEDEHNGSDLELQSKKVTAKPQVTSTENNFLQKKDKKAKLVAQKITQETKKKTENEVHKKYQENLETLTSVQKMSTKKQQKCINPKLGEKTATISSSKLNKQSSNSKNQQEQLHEETNKKTVSQRTSNKTALSASNGCNRKMKCVSRPNTAQTTEQVHKSDSTANVVANNSSSFSGSRLKNNSRNLNRNQIQQPIEHNSHQNLSSSANSENKYKRTQRNKKYPQKQPKSSMSQHEKCCSGIPNNMGYFDPNEVSIAHPSNQTTSTQKISYQTLADQMQAMRISNNLGQIHPPSMSAQQNRREQHITSNNVSIMDQLNRGVQVENLSLPPGITLTKVDPIKSEQLRQKSESIKKLAKPLQQTSQQHSSQPTFHHPAMATPILAPPVTPISSFYGSPYSASLDNSSGIIMVEANPTKSNPSSVSINKTSKNKKRRNKTNANNGPCSFVGNSSNNMGMTGASKQYKNCDVGAAGLPKMITLRNPMFHGTPTTSSAAVMPQSTVIQGHPIDSYPTTAETTPLSVDQPAAIIRNENGMYTIRNPALHQAVTNGMVLGGYRQFGNVNYYTPQEAAAEATRATMAQQQHLTSENCKATSTGNNAGSSSYSYFLTDNSQTNASHNNISISCSSIADRASSISPQSSGCGGLTGDAAVIQRPTPSLKCISAIGSEIKSAQQQKQKTKEQHWSNFGPDTLPINKCDNITRSSSFLCAVSEGANSVSVGADLTLQEKYQQSKYYNGFDVFTGTSGGSSSSAVAGPHMHHSCGDDSPPPRITGYNSYLDGIPNTGIIRYDDASFLKNLIPGQNLNNEVSIHNVNESNFVRNAHSPQAHSVEITPVFGTNRPPSTNIFEVNSGQANYRGNYREQLDDYNNDSNLFSNNNLKMNLDELDSALKYDFESPQTSVANAAVSDNHHSILDLNDILSKNGTDGPTPSHRTSPYMEGSLEGFVQNMNSLHISMTDEQSSQLNTSHSGQPVTTSASTTSNGWW